jgi:hypothetical protein
MAFTTRVLLLLTLLPLVLQWRCGMSDPTGAEGACSGLFCPSHRLRT